MFYEKLKELRKNNNLTQKELAKIIGCNQSMITRWEKNENEPTYSFLIKIAKCFNCTVDYLIGQEDDSSNKKITSSLTSKEERLLKAFQFLDNDEQNKIIEDCEYFANKHTNKNKIAK